MQLEPNFGIYIAVAYIILATKHTMKIITDKEYNSFVVNEKKLHIGTKKYEDWKPFVIIDEEDTTIELFDNSGKKFYTNANQDNLLTDDEFKEFINAIYE